MRLAVDNSRLGKVWSGGMKDRHQVTSETSAPEMTVTAVGLDERMVCAISLFFRIRLANRYAFGEPRDADIWIFDLDSVDGRSRWARHRNERPEDPAILLSITEKGLSGMDNVAFAPKPLSPVALTAALDQVARSVRKATPPQKARIDRERGYRREPEDASATATLLPFRAGSTPGDSDTTPSGPMKSASATEGAASDGSGPASSSDQLTREMPEGAARPETFMPDNERDHELSWADEPLETEPRKSPEAASAPTARYSAPNCYDAAKKLDIQNPQAFIGTRPDIDASDSQQIRHAQFDPERFLAGAVSNAVTIANRTQRPFRVSGKDWCIVVVPEKDRAFVDIERAKFKALASLLLQGEVTTEELIPSERDKTPRGVKWRLSTLQWALSLMAARGRVPIDTDLNAKVKLTHWPNLTRLQTFPNAMRIASLWSRRPISLLESASVLGIHQRYVFAFYSAVRAIGLVATQPPENRERENTPDRPVKRHRNLFRKILAHLRFGRTSARSLAHE